MERGSWSLLHIILYSYLAYVNISGSPVHVHRVERSVDCSAVELFEHPQCQRFLDEALLLGLETTEGVRHYCNQIAFYPHCLRRHTKDYKYLYRCGVLGNNLSSTLGAEKWFNLMTDLQYGFEDVVCNHRTPQAFIEAIDCYKENASHVFYACSSAVPEEFLYFFYEGFQMNRQYENYLYRSYLYLSAQCLGPGINSFCGDKSRDLLDDVYTVIINGAYARAFDCSFF